jgi:hypothetical protein
MRIQVSVDMTRADVFRAAKHYYGRTPLRWVRWAFGVVLLAVGLPHLLLGKTSGFAVGGVVYAALLFLLPRINAWYLARNHFTNPNLSPKWEYEFTDSGIGSQSPHGSGTSDWSIVMNWQESPGGFLLVIRKGFFYFVPKRGFRNDADIVEFREFLTSRYGKAK